MKCFIFSLLLISLVACRSPSTTDVHIFNNTTNHVIDIELFRRTQTDIKVKIRLENNSTNNSLFTTGRGSAEYLSDVYDSVLVVYDDTVSIMHYRKSGLEPDYFENHILDIYSWTYVQTTEVKRKEFKRDLIYTFTEEDYLNAL